MNKKIYKFEEVIKNIGDFELETRIKSITGEIYELRIAENGQRKFSRMNGTKLRFMSYDNICKEFELLEDNTEEIEEIKGWGLATDYKDFETINHILDRFGNKINEIIRVYNKLRKEQE